jgi:hypothetical protein
LVSLLRLNTLGARKELLGTTLEEEGCDEELVNVEEKTVYCLESNRE